MPLSIWLNIVSATEIKNFFNFSVVIAKFSQTIEKYLFSCSYNRIRLLIIKKIQIPVWLNIVFTTEKQIYCIFSEGRDKFSQIIEKQFFIVYLTDFNYFYSKVLLFVWLNTAFTTKNTKFSIFSVVTLKFSQTIECQ